MRTYTFERACGHTVRGKSSDVLQFPCLDCTLEQTRNTDDPVELKRIEDEYLSKRQAVINKKKRRKHVSR